MTGRAEQIAAVLAEHALSWPRGYAGYVCKCDAEFDDGDDGEVGRAHVAAVVDAALTAQERCVCPDDECHEAGGVGCYFGTAQVGGRGGADTEADEATIDAMVDAMVEVQQEFREDVSFHDFARAALAAAITTGGLAERTTSLDSRDEQSVTAGLEVPEAQAQTTVPAPPTDPTRGRGGADTTTGGAGRRPGCLPFCNAGLHESTCPNAAAREGN